MQSIAVLDAAARRLNRGAGAPPIPALYFFTDPARTPDPLGVAARLSAGAAIVYRHFGAEDRSAIARALSSLARKNGLWLLIGNDPALALKVGADGVHWSQKRLRARAGFRLETAAAHDARALARAAAFGMDAAILAPVLPSRSPSAQKPIGAFRAARLARQAPLPVIALGGISARTAHAIGPGFAGLAAIDAFLRA